MSISAVVIFISEVSEKCIEVVKFIKKKSLPVKLVRLDTKEARARAMKGSVINIKQVPTIIVMFDDGDLQSFIGYSKSISWLTYFSKLITDKTKKLRYEKKPRLPIEEESEEEVEEIEYEEEEEEENPKKEEEIEIDFVSSSVVETPIKEEDGKKEINITIEKTVKQTIDSDTRAKAKEMMEAAKKTRGFAFD